MDTHHHDVCEVHDVILSTCRCMARDKERRRVPCPGPSCPGYSPSAEPESLSKAPTAQVQVAAIAKSILDQDRPNPIRQMCELAVLDLDPGAVFDDWTISMSAEQARQAVAAVFATLAYHDRLPRDLIE